MRQYASWLLFIAVGTAQDRFPCPSGEIRIRINEKQLAIQYSGQEMVSTMGPLSYMGARMIVAPKTLQTAAAVTQVWNEYVKGLAAGWDACAVTKEQSLLARKWTTAAISSGLPTRFIGILSVM